MSDQVKEVVHVLKKPYKAGDKSIEKITLSEPPASKLRGVKLNLPSSKNVKSVEFDIDTALTVVEACADITPPEVGLMSMGDLNAVYWKCIELFFG